MLSEDYNGLGTKGSPYSLPETRHCGLNFKVESVYFRLSEIPDFSASYVFRASGMNIVSSGLLPGITFGLALIVGTASASPAKPESHGNGPAIYIPLSSNCFKTPTFTPSFPGGTLSRSVDIGNYHYAMTYKYDSKKKHWVLSEYRARMIQILPKQPATVLKAASKQAKSCPINSLAVN